MAEASIPVDLFNPGQVFACLGFLEAADILLGDAEGGFDWSNDADVRFKLRAADEEHPVEAVLRFLAAAEVVEVEPLGWPGEHDPASMTDERFPCSKSEFWDSQNKKWTRTALPVSIKSGGGSVPLTHWADGSSRSTFKLYSGNRSAHGIATTMIRGKRKKPKKSQTIGDVELKGVAQLWGEHSDELTARPFDVLTDMGGSFNFDLRGAWTAIDAGFSPDTQSYSVTASPIVELLAAFGLQNARPAEFGVRGVRYAVWSLTLPPMLARAALSCALVFGPVRKFTFELALAGKNKVVTFANQDLTP